MNISIKQLQKAYDHLTEIPEPMIHKSFVADFKQAKKILKDLINSNVQIGFIEAAEILNVSTTYLEKLIGEGRLIHRGTGLSEYILLKDVLDYKEKRDKIRHEKLQELTELSQELGLYDN